MAHMHLLSLHLAVIPIHYDSFYLRHAHTDTHTHNAASKLLTER